MKLGGKVAIITGASTGIGRASALAFAGEGAKVVIADINDKDGQEAAEGIKKSGWEAMYMHIDVSKPAELQKMIQMTVAEYKRLDIFFHNAGVAGPGVLDNTEEAAYDLLMGVNLKAGFFGAKYAVPEIRKAGGGSILFTSSTSGVHPSPGGSPAYSMSKAGLLMLTKSLALYLAKDNIRVNAICPGPITETPLWAKLSSRNPGVDPEKLTRNIIENTVPLKRAGTVEEMAAAALFLVSPEAGYITGVALPVDGGTLAM